MATSWQTGIWVRFGLYGEEIFPIYSYSKEAYAVIKRDSEIVKIICWKNGVGFREDELVFSPWIFPALSHEHDENGNYIRDYPDGWRFVPEPVNLSRYWQGGRIISRDITKLIESGVNCIQFTWILLYQTGWGVEPIWKGKRQIQAEDWYGGWKWCRTGESLLSANLGVFPDYQEFDPERVQLRDGAPFDNGAPI